MEWQYPLVYAIVALAAWNVVRTFRQLIGGMRADGGCSACPGCDDKPAQRPATGLITLDDLAATATPRARLRG